MGGVFGRTLVSIFVEFAEVILVERAFGITMGVGLFHAVRIDEKDWK